MPTLEDAKQHLIKMIIAIEDVDEYEKIGSFVHSLEIICACVHSEKALSPFMQRQEYRIVDEFPPTIDDD